MEIIKHRTSTSGKKQKKGISQGAAIPEYKRLLYQVRPGETRRVYVCLCMNTYIYIYLYMY